MTFRASLFCVGLAALGFTIPCAAQQFEFSELAPIIDLDDDASIISHANLSGGETFVSDTIIFLEGVQKGEKTKSTELRALINELTRIYDNEMDVDMRLYANDPRQNALWKEHGSLKGQQIWWQEIAFAQMAMGKIVTIDQQRDVTWKLWSTLANEDSGSEFAESLDRAFNFYLLIHAGIVPILEDRHYVKRLGLDADEANHIASIAKAAEDTFQKELLKAKRQSLENVFETLTESQQAKLCRMLGLSKTGFCRIYDQLPSSAIASYLAGDQHVDGNGSLILLRRIMGSQLVEEFVRLKRRSMSDEEITRLSESVETALDQLPYFLVPDQEFVESANLRFENIKDYLASDERKQSKKLAGNIEKLLNGLAEKRVEPSLEEFRSDKPMIFRLAETDQLSDDPVGLLDVKPIYHKSAPPGNFYIPVLDQPDAFDILIDDSIIVQQHEEVEKIQLQWIADHGRSKNYSDEIEINNRYLKKLNDEVLLPHQSLYLFRRFVATFGPVNVFRLHDIGQHFETSKQQLATLKRIGAESGEELLAVERRLNSERMQKVLDAIPQSKTRAFETALGHTKIELKERQAQFKYLFRMNSPYQGMKSEERISMFNRGIGR